MGGWGFLCVFFIVEKVRNRWYVGNQSSYDKAPYRLWRALLKLCLDTITVRPKGHHDQS